MDWVTGDLLSALGSVPGEVIAFVGAGGKTTAAWRLLQELRGVGKPAVFTTTTQIFKPRSGWAELILDADPAAGDVSRALAGASSVVVAARLGRRADRHRPGGYPYPATGVKVTGLAPAVVDRLSRQLPAVTWLVEADGARGRLLKAPAAHEPVIPSGTNRVVVVASLDAVGRALDKGTVHRSEIVARLLGVELGALIMPEMIADTVSHPSGGMKGVPSGAQAVLLLTDWGEADRSTGAAVADRVLRSGRIDRIVETDLRRAESVRAVWRS